MKKLALISAGVLEPNFLALTKQQLGRYFGDSSVVVMVYQGVGLLSYGHNFTSLGENYQYRNKVPAGWLKPELFDNTDGDNLLVVVMDYDGQRNNFDSSATYYFDLYWRASMERAWVRPGEYPGPSPTGKEWQKLRRTTNPSRGDDKMDFVIQQPGNIRVIEYISVDYVEWGIPLVDLSGGVLLLDPYKFRWAAPTNTDADAFAQPKAREGRVYRALDNSLVQLVQ